MKELDFKRRFRARLAEGGNWTDAFEPAYGTTMGCPDIAVQFDKFQVVLDGPARLAQVKPIVFCELKVGAIVDGGQLKVTVIRPAQYSWHRVFTASGGVCCFVVGVGGPKSWKAFVLKGMDAKRFGEFNKNGIVRKDEYKDWPEKLSLRNYIEMREWARA